jgi:NAD(P)-dependent dehydrogenase (short-subunit alcohol dehydrogenase family)
MGVLEGRVAIVTGASSGIGKACALRFAEEGAAIVGCARRMDKLEELVAAVQRSGRRAAAVACDVADEADIDRVVAAAAEQFGQIDILVNVAQGGLERHSGPRITEITRDAALELYVTGPLQSMTFMQKCFPYMKEKRYGRIINIGSHAAYGAPGMSAYGMAKAAAMSLTRTASQEWGEFGIVTNTIVPMVLTDAWYHTEQTRQHVDSIASHVPVGRLGAPYDDVAPAAVFLASEQAGYVNGQVIAVDGGMRLIA